MLGQKQLLKLTTLSGNFKSFYLQLPLNQARTQDEKKKEEVQGKKRVTEL